METYPYELESDEYWDDVEDIALEPHVRAHGICPRPMFEIFDLHPCSAPEDTEEYCTHG